MTRVFGVVLLVVAFGCGTTQDPDSGVTNPMDASVDSAEPCSADPACSDGVYCNGVELCRPTMARADSRGCVPPAGPPCLPTQTCDEAVEQCVNACGQEPDMDSDGHDSIACGGDDCDDADPAVHGGAEELCNGVDDDCDGTLNGPGEDDDGDGYADDECAGEGAADCDDEDATIYDGAVELCDRIDQDCSNPDHRRPIGGAPENADAPEEDADSDMHAPIGAACEGGPLPKDDCDDTNGTVYPGSVELCDGVLDEDCDRLIDEESVPLCILPNAVATCTLGVCTLASCLSGYLDCTPDAGCETESATSPLSCGACDNVCIAGTSCRDSACRPAHGYSLDLGPATSEPGALVVDAAGNVYVAGAFEGALVIGGRTLTSAGLTDIFVASFDTTGAHRWSARYGSTGDDGAEDITLGPAGHVWVTGRISGRVNLGTRLHITPGDSADMFVSSLQASDGAPRLSWHFGGFADDYGRSLVLSPAGLVYLLGDAAGAIGFGAFLVRPAGLTDPFLAALLPDSSPIWVTRFGGRFEDHGWGLARDSAGNLYAVGSFSTSGSFGSGTVMPDSGSVDGFVASWDSAGFPRWSRAIGGPGADVAREVSVSASQVTVVGRVGAAFDAGGGPLTFLGAEDGFVASYTNALGTHVWSRALATGGTDGAESIATDAAGNVFVVGNIGARGFDAGGGVLPFAGGSDHYAASFGAMGAHRWSRTFGGAGSDAARHVAIDATGRVYVSGTFEGMVDFGGGVRTAAAADSDGFILRLEP